MGMFQYEEQSWCHYSKDFVSCARMVRSQQSASMDARHAASIQNIMMNPHDIPMKNISIVFLGTMLEVTNMRYFNVENIAVEHEQDCRTPQVQRGTEVAPSVGTASDV
jgi:hypothetical protein